MPPGVCGRRRGAAGAQASSGAPEQLKMAESVPASLRAGSWARVLAVLLASLLRGEHNQPFPDSRAVGPQHGGKGLRSGVAVRESTLVFRWGRGSVKDGSANKTKLEQKPG